jgi:hypothetical protein
MIGLSSVGRLGLQPVRPAGGGAYNALLGAALSAARSTDTGLWFVADDLSNCWQDAAGTIPCTTAGNPVGRCNDMQYGSANASLGAAAFGYHATQSTAGSRPTLVRLANGRWGLSYASGQFLSGPAPNSPAEETLISAVAVANNDSIRSLGGRRVGNTGLFTRWNAMQALYVAYFPDGTTLRTISLPGSAVANEMSVVSLVGKSGSSFASKDGVAATPIAFAYVSATSATQLGLVAEQGSAGVTLLGSFALMAYAASALPNPERIAIERFAHAHAGVNTPYNG